jgi:hypothetical protein
VRDLIMDCRDALSREQLYREALEELAAQSSGIPGSTAKADCMAAIARAALGVGDATDVD